MQQNEALSLLKMGKNIFLTGEAGSGKTYILNKYIQYLKDNHVNVAVTASTGIAATHLQGVTIHSWSGIGVRDRMTQNDLEKLLEKKHIKNNYQKTKVLIIDEISMLHTHQLDMVDSIARYILNCEQPFGGMQIVLCGDFFQLPPVSSSVGEKMFAFEASAWKKGDFQVCYLHEQYRQKNDPLNLILNEIRTATVSERARIYLRTRYKKEPQIVGITKTTKLYSRNMNVDAINERELMRIDGQERTFTMTCVGFSGLVEGLKKSCLAPEKLKLKMGAEVMFIKNDQTGKYVNGTRGVVVRFDRIEGWPIVKTYKNETIVACPEEWKYEENGVIRATIHQVPLRLAWAITVHKSQGMTLDAAEIDLGDAFEPGMGYVALSRIRSLNGLKLINLNEMALKVHPKILQYDQVLKDHSTDAMKYFQSLSQKEIIDFQQKTLLERFTNGKVKDKKNIKNIHRIHKKEKIPTHLISLSMLKKNLSIETIAEKRKLSVGTIITHLEKLKALKKIDNFCLSKLKATLPKNVFDAILAEFKKSATGHLKPIHDKFGGKYSYTTIQLVRLFGNSSGG